MKYVAYSIVKKVFQSVWIKIYFERFTMLHSLYILIQKYGTETESISSYKNKLRKI